MRDRPGRDVSRIEGFSDAVFGFALPLLVASIEVPPDFQALKQTLRGFLPFALTFALVCWIWYRGLWTPEEVSFIDARAPVSSPRAPI